MMQSDMRALWNFKQYSENIALITDAGERYTYSQLLDLIERYAFMSEDKELVFIIAENTVTCLGIYISCMLKGSVPFMLDKGVSLDLFEKLLERYMPKYVYLPKVKKDYATRSLSHIYSTNDGIIAQNRKGYSGKIYSQLALLLPTSGSTGSSKMVRQSYKNIVENTLSICDFLELTESERCITTMPICYTYGLSIINTHLHVGGTIVLTSKSILEKQFWELFCKYQVTSFSGVPYHYFLLKKMSFTERNLRDLRYMTQAGGALEEKEVLYWGKYAQKENKKFFVMYGQTEATARISYLPYRECLDRPGSVGIPISSGNIRIINKEIVYSGPNVCMGYAESRADLKKGDDWKGVLYTGDQGYLDRDGFLYITGRKNREAKLYGKRINLKEVESFLKNVTGTMIYVVTHENVMYLLSEVYRDDRICDTVARRLGISRRNVFLNTVENIPRKDSGKVDYMGCVEEIKKNGELKLCRK